MEIHYDDMSDVTFDLSKDNNYTQSGRKWDSKSTISTKVVSKNASKNTTISLVGMIFMDESPHGKHSITG